MAGCAFNDKEGFRQKLSLSCPFLGFVKRLSSLKKHKCLILSRKIWKNLEATALTFVEQLKALPPGDQILKF
jgi:hypothetical protein